jgi:hypothetical protein
MEERRSISPLTFRGKNLVTLSPLSNVIFFLRLLHYKFKFYSSSITFSISNFKKYQTEICRTYIFSGESSCDIFIGRLAFVYTTKNCPCIWLIFTVPTEEIFGQEQQYVAVRLDPRSTSSLRLQAIVYTVIRFVSNKATFGICAIFGLDGTLVDARIPTWDTWMRVF